MIIKHIFLSALLIVPLGVQASNVAQVRAEKIAELENLNVKIATKEAAIDAIVESGRNILREVYKSDDAVTESYIRSLVSDIDIYLQELKNSRLTLEIITKCLNYEFTNDERDTISENRDLIKRLRFALLRWKIEYMLLDELLGQYRQCANELAMIDAK